MLDSLSKKQKIIFFILLSIMISVIFYYIYSTIYSDNSFSIVSNTNYIENDLIENNTLNINSDFNILENINTDNNNKIIVYICGAVKESKVISLNENSRICDAIDAVGGLTKEADLTNINLAYILEDGEKIYIPKKGEEINTNNNLNKESSSYTNYSSSELLNNKININKATQTELETIPGIGPSTALKIINYRKENGKFSSLEDIKNISGIGDSKYKKIKDYICIK